MPAALAATAQTAELEISPKVCVVVASDSACTMTVKVAWHSTRTGNYCVRTQGSGEVLRCWEGAREGRFDYAYRHERGVVLELVAADESSTLEDKAKIVTVSREVRDARRRRRHVWSIL